MKMTILAAAGLFALTAGAHAASPAPINEIDGVALHGFDPVAYFTQNKAVKGSPQHLAHYNGVTYEFASKEDQAAFEAAPARYAPQYGGFCSFAVTEGIKADIDPHAFAINDGKLYLNYSEGARDSFQADVRANTSKAEENWPSVSAQSKILR